MINIIKSILNPYSRSNFVLSIKNRGVLLDVGCGNDSPYRTKLIRPDLYYIGIDIVKLSSEKSKRSANQFILSANNLFLDDLNRLEKCDAIICSHVVEHVEDPNALIKALLSKIKSSGSLYLSYPTKRSVNFPRRKGTLNFYDDPTHRNVIDGNEVLKSIDLNLYEVKYKISNRPVILALIGLILEPVSALFRRLAPFGATWALYGFEDVFIIRKKSNEEAV